MENRKSICGTCHGVMDRYSNLCPHCGRRYGFHMTQPRWWFLFGCIMFLMWIILLAKG
jgi:predicted amidophosphoribosyltransferase